MAPLDVSAPRPGVHLQVIEGDCIDVMRGMAAASIQCFCFSPVYNFGARYSRHNDRMPEDTYFAMLDAAAQQQARLLNPLGHLFINIGTNIEFPWRAMDVARVYGRHFKLRQTIAWIKSIAIDASTIRDEVFRDALRDWGAARGIDLGDLPYDALRHALHGYTLGHFTSLSTDRICNPCWEPVYHFTLDERAPIDRLSGGVPYVYKNQPRRFGHNRTLHDRGNALHAPYATSQSRADKDNHPSTYPVALAEHCLRLSGAKPGDLVMDPFCGTGTTLVAAQQLGLHGIGVEIDGAYCAAARRRLGMD
jgi:site-specific DNA-methyltransferase (adenine-specific)